MITYEVTVQDNGTKEWRLNGKLHREDGPAIEWTDGTKYWCKNGQYHREDGPAIELANGGKAWYKNGKRHREDGPAVDWTNDAKSWYLDDKYYTEAEFKAKMAKPSCEGKTVTIDGIKYKLSKA